MADKGTEERLREMSSKIRLVPEDHSSARCVVFELHLTEDIYNTDLETAMEIVFEKCKELMDGIFETLEPIQAIGVNTFFELPDHKKDALLAEWIH